MWLLDQWAERHIAEAQAKGEFDNLAGSGEPLILDVSLVEEWRLLTART